MEVFAWVSSAAVVTVLSLWLTHSWERKKLNRAERSAAYAEFLSIFSKRWKAFAERDGAKKRRDQVAQDAAEAQVGKLRDDLYDAYSKIQVLGSQEVVEAALNCLRLSDDRNRAFKNKDFPGVPADARMIALARFIKMSRIDLSLEALDTDRLRQGSTSQSGALLPEVTDGDSVVHS